MYDSQQHSYDAGQQYSGYSADYDSGYNAHDSSYLGASGDNTGGYTQAPPPAAPVYAEPHVGNSAAAPLGRPLQVLHEDCQGRGGHLTPSQAPPVPLTKVAQGAVYVQHARDASRFKPVAAQKVRRMMGASDADTSRFSDTSDLNLSRISATSQCTAISFGAPSSLPFDSSDIARLDLTSIADAQVYDLIVFTRHCETLAALAFFICQCVLAGLCLVSGLVAQGTRSDDELLLALKVLEPGRGRVMHWLSEVALVGSILQTMVTCDRFRGSDGGSMSSSKEVAEHRYAARHCLFSLFATASNIAILVCCLIGARSDVYVFEYGYRSSGSWEAAVTRGVLRAQPYFGFVAVLFALPHTMDLLARPRTVGAFDDSLALACEA